MELRDLVELSFLDPFVFFSLILDKFFVALDLLLVSFQILANRLQVKSGRSTLDARLDINVDGFLVHHGIIEIFFDSFYLTIFDGLGLINNGCIQELMWL